MSDAREVTEPNPGASLDRLSRAQPVIERAPLPMIEVAGKDHYVCFVNAAFCRLVGRTREELIGKQFVEIVSNGDKCVPLLDRVYQTGEPETLVESEGTEADPTHWLYAMWPAMDENEMPARVVVQLSRSSFFRRNEMEINAALLIGALRQHELREAAEKANARLEEEIAERKLAAIALREAVDNLQIARRAAEQANQAKDDFLAALSHELRTPLTPVLLTAEALLEDQRLPADVREQIGMIERNIALEARMIDDLLDVTRIAHGKLELIRQPCDAHHLIDLAIDIVRKDAAAKNITIERDFDARHSGLSADPARFQQVIWNLLRNAVKFTPPRGKIFIRTREESGKDGMPWLRIEVADTGIGIASTQLEKIFLPFDQGELAGRHLFGGLGLGLAIVRSVVHLHGGTISTHSAGLNRGATFVVELPGVTAPSVGAVEPFVSPLEGAVSLRLLVVEDDPSTLQVLSRLLERRGHHVVAARTAAAALAMAAVDTFDVVISDLGLPDASGLELIKQLRDCQDLRGIALSGYGSEEDIARSRAAGFDIHLVKPIQFAQLRSALATLMRK